HIQQQWTRASLIHIVIVQQCKPVGRRPVIAGRSTKDRARLKTNHCFAAAPGPSGVVSVPGGNEGIATVTGDTASCPYTAAHGAGGPRCYAGWIVDRHTHQPAMPRGAVINAPIPNIKNVANDAERRSLRLDRGSEGRTVVLGCGLHIHRPTRVNGPG